MSDLSSRLSVNSVVNTEWDILVIGGGIIGAAIMREAARYGQKVILFEQNDFASGTSSTSSKLVHGGLHYLARYQIGLSYISVRERERLIREGEGLVRRIGVIYPAYQDEAWPDWLIQAGLNLYGMLSGRLGNHHKLKLSEIDKYAPDLNRFLFNSIYHYDEAITDDARLVIRVLLDGCRYGGYAMNYTKVTELLHDTRGHIYGVRILDREGGYSGEVRGRIVINSTGPWAEHLHFHPDKLPKLRLIRGSHLVIPWNRLPIKSIIATLHPQSRDPFYLIPWIGVTLVGSTNVIHTDKLQDHPHISVDEFNYLVNGVQKLFPDCKITSSDIIATFSGIRPITDTRTKDFAKASREHSIWEEDGMVTVVGGKLTTFRRIALEVMLLLRHHLPELPRIDMNVPAFDSEGLIPLDLPVSQVLSRQFLARYGRQGFNSIARAPNAELHNIHGPHTCGAELRWIACNEGVCHLDDLVLRRVNIGIRTKEGGKHWIQTIRPFVQSELGWDDQRWNTEVESYLELWHRIFSVPEMNGS